MHIGNYDVNEANFWAKVDRREGGCWPWLASRGRGDYGQFRLLVDGRATMMGAHRVAYLIQHGMIAAGLQVDHICRNRLCVNPDHLRLTTAKQNGENRVGAQANSRSGVRGVSWHRAKSKWHAHVRSAGVRVNVGYFDDLRIAEAAVVAARRTLFTHNEADRVAY